MRPLAAACLMLAAVVALRADATNVRITATVTDAQGRPVSGLSANDFQIREDNQSQKIVSVEPRPAGPRRFAIILDEFHVDAADTARVRDAVAGFVRDDLRPDDSAAVLKPLDPLSKIHFDADRGALQAAIASFEGRKGNYEPRTLLEEETLGRAPALVEAGRNQVVLSALRALTSLLGNAPAHAAILLVSDGFDMSRGQSAARGLPDEGVVERFANRFDVPVYLLDPRDGAADTPVSPLSRLVGDTGGTVARGDLAAALGRAARDLDGGYVLTYQPAHPDDGRFHPVTIAAIRKPALEVRARTGYVSPPSEEMRRAMRSPTLAPLLAGRSLHRSPFIDVWSGVTHATTSSAHVVITFEPTGLGANAASRVALKATTRDGRLLFEGFLSPARAGTGLALSSSRADFDAPIGPIQIDMTVLNLAGQKLDVDTRDLDIAVPKGGTPMLLPPVIIATESALAFRQAAADPNATPDPSHAYRRTERLIVRVPAYTTQGEAAVSVRLLNRLGQVMRTLDPMAPSNGTAQFDFPLATLAPGEYYFDITATANGIATAQRIGFTVTG